MKIEKNLNMVDMKQPETLCYVYPDREIKNVEITYNDLGLPESYSASAYNYGAHLAWKDFCEYLKLPAKEKKKRGEYKLDFKKLGIDPHGDYTNIIDEQKIHKICSGEG